MRSYSHLSDDERDQIGILWAAGRSIAIAEEEMFACRRDLLTTLDIVFMDTTSLYFEGAGGQTLGRRAASPRIIGPISIR